MEEAPEVVLKADNVGASRQKQCQSRTEEGALWEACVRSHYGVREDELSHAVDAHLERAVV